MIKIKKMLIKIILENLLAVIIVAAVILGMNLSGVVIEKPLISSTDSNITGICYIADAEES